MRPTDFFKLQKARADFATKFRAAGPRDFFRLIADTVEGVEDDALAADFRDAANALRLALEWDGTFGLNGNSQKMHATLARRKNSFPHFKPEAVVREIGVLLAGWNLIPVQKGCSKIHSHGISDLTLTLSPEDARAAFDFAARFTAEARGILAIEFAFNAAKHDTARTEAITAEIDEARRTTEAKQRREARKEAKKAGTGPQLPVETLPLFAA